MDSKSLFCVIFLLAILLIYAKPPDLDDTTRERIAAIADAVERKIRDHDSLVDVAQEIRKLQKLISNSETFKKYNQIFNIEESLQNLQDKMPESGSPIASLVNSLKVYFDGIKGQLFSFVPHEMNFIWIGKLGEIQKQYLDTWLKVHSNAGSDYKMTIWTDPSAYLAYYMKSLLRDHVDSIVTGSTKVKYVLYDYMRLMIELQNTVNREINRQMNDGKSYDDATAIAIEKYMLGNRDQIESTLREYKDSWNLKNVGDLKIKDIGTLWEENDEMLKIYHQELSLRQNLPAATDVARYRVLKKFGGVYADMDLLPALNEVTLSEFLTEHSELFLQGTTLHTMNEILRNRIKRAVTKKVMDTQFPENTGRYKDFIGDMIEKAPKDFDWRAFRDLQVVNDDPQSFFKWFSPLDNLFVPPGAKAGLNSRGDHEYYNNNFLCAAKTDEQYNPGMHSVENLIKERYKNLPDKYVYSTHGVHPSWPPNFDRGDYGTSMLYRTDGLIQYSQATVYLTGPQTVVAGYAKVGADIMKPELTAKRYAEKVADHAFSDEAFNVFTDEEERSSWFQRDEQEGLLFVEAEPNFKAVLQIGEDDVVAFASDAIFRKGLGRQDTMHLKWNPSELRMERWDHTVESFVPIRPLQDKIPPLAGYDSESHAVIRQKMNLEIVGHGDGTGGIKGITSTVLAHKLSQLVPEGISMGKISVTACQAEYTQTTGELQPGYLKSFLDGLGKRLRPQQVSIRNTLLQVDQFGRKWYAFLKDILSNGESTYDGSGEQGSSKKEYGWTRKTSKKNPIYKLIVTWNERLQSWFCSTNNIDHEAVAVLDAAADLSGQLHTAMTGMDIPLSLSVSAPKIEEYRDLVLDRSIFDIPEQTTAIVTEPGLLALLNALRSSEQPVYIVGSSPAGLETTRHMLILLEQGAELKHGLKMINAHYPPFGELLETKILEAQSQGFLLNHIKLKERIAKRKISFVPMDMTSHSASNYMLNVNGIRDNHLAFFLSDHPNPDNLSPSMSDEPKSIQRLGLMKTLAGCLNYGGGTLRILRGLNPNSIISSLKKLGHYEKIQKFLASGRHLFTTLKAKKLVHNLLRSTKRLLKKAQLPSDFVVVLEAIELPRRKHNGFSLPLVSSKNPAVVKTVKTFDKTFYKVKTELEKVFQSTKRAAERWRETETMHSYEPEPVNTLSAGMFAVALTHIVRGFQANDSSSLSTTIEIQMSLNFAAGGIAVAADIGRVIKLVQVGLREGTIAAVETTAKLMTRTLGALSKADKVFGGVMSVANVIFDIVEFNLAHTAAEKAMFASNMAIDVANVALMGFAIAASGPAAAIAAYAAAPLAGVGIGLTALVGAYMEVAQGASQVGLYFGRLDEGFINAYRFEEGYFLPNPISVIKEIDFKRGVIRLGSPKLVKSKKHYSKAGDADIFLDWAHKGEILDGWTDNTSDVFDIRKRLGHPESQLENFEARENKHPVIVLPITPDSTISYHHNTLPYATTRHDYGFSILRRLEECDDFDYDYSLMWPFPPFVFYVDWIIDWISHYYHRTVIQIVLDRQDRTLAIPKPTRPMHCMISYRFIGSSGITTILLQKYIDTYILSHDDDSDVVTWILDTTIMNKGEPAISVQRENGMIHLEGTWIDYRAMKSFKSIIKIVTATNVLLFDAKTGNYEALDENGSQFASAGSLHTHLSTLVKDHHAGGSFVEVYNAKDFITNESISVAFYDTQKDKLVYTVQRTTSIVMADVKLVGANEIYSWFISVKLGRIWCTNSKSRDVVFEAQLFDPEQTSSTRITSFRLTKNSHALIEIMHVQQLESAFCRYVAKLDQLLLVAMEIRSSRPEEWGVFRIETPRTLHYFTKISAERKYTSLGYSPFYFASLSEWVEYTVRKPDDSNEGNHNLVYHFWIHKKTSLAVNPRYEDTMELFRALFMPLSGDAISPESNLLVYFGSTRMLYIYIPTSKYEGELSQLQKNVTNLIHRGNFALAVSTNGKIVQRLPNRKSKSFGYTTKALEQSLWQGEVGHEISAEYLVPFYELQQTGLNYSGIWYFPHPRSFVIVDPLFDNGQFRVIDILIYHSLALLLTSNGSLWTLPLVRHRDVSFISPFSEFVASYNYTEPELWSEWNERDEIDKGRHWKGEIVLESKSGIIFDIKEVGMSIAFQLKGLVINKNSITKDILLTKLEQVLSLHIELPIEDYVPVRSKSSTGWMIHFTDDISDVQYLDSTEVHGKPLGVDRHGRLVLFDLSAHTLRENTSLETANMFEMASRAGSQLILLSDKKQDTIVVPELRGVKSLIVTLQGRSQRLIVPESMNEVALDTLELKNTSVVELRTDWDVVNPSHLIEEDEIMITTHENKAIYWKGQEGHKLKIQGENDVTSTMSIKGILSALT